MNALDRDPLIALGAELERLDELEETGPDAWAKRVGEQINECWDQIGRAVPTSIEGALVQTRFLRRYIVGNIEGHYMEIIDNLIAGLEQLDAANPGAPHPS